MEYKELLKQLYEIDAISVNIHTNNFDIHGECTEVGTVAEYDNSFELMLEDGTDISIKTQDITSINGGAEDIKIEFKDGSQIIFFNLTTAAD